MLEAWRGELLIWRETIRGLPHNPIANYFRITEQRRRGRRRSRAWIWITGLVIMILIGLVLVWQMFIVPLGSGYSPDLWEIIMLILGLIMIAISVAYGAAMIHTLFRSCLDAFGVLGVEAPGRAKPRRLLIDDMLATTTMTDHEIAAGVLWVLVPPLWKVALAGGCVYWGWLILVRIPGLEYGGDSDLIQQIITGPLLIAGVTLCGSLAVLVILTWLMTIGATVSRQFHAAGAAWMICVGQLVMIPVSIALAANSSDSMIYNRPGMVSRQLTWDVCVALGLTLLFAWLLSLALRRPGRYSGLGWVIPLLAPFSLGFIIFMMEQSANYEVGEHFVLAYMKAWSAVTLLNTTALPSVYCIAGYRELDFQNFGVEASYVLLLLQLILMVGFGLNAARRAVGIRRQCGG